MKASLLLALAATAAAAPAANLNLPGVAAPDSNTWKITVSLFEGVLQGFFTSGDFPHIKECVADGNETYHRLEKAIDELEAKSMEAGIHDLGVAITDLKTALTTCKASEAEISKLVKAVEDGFKHPLSFLYKVGQELIVNGADILHEIELAVADWKAGKYHDAGLQIGLALSKLLPEALEWEAWKSLHGKQYGSSAEEATRRAAFELSKSLLGVGGADSVVYRLNEFADLTPSEFNSRMNGLTPGKLPHTSRQHALSGAAAPDAVDWRAKNLVAPVKNQGSCGSCWAFSTVVSIEGQHAKQTGKLVSLSEQNLVDCVKGVTLPNETGTCCMGCRGGLMDDAFQYLLDKQAGAIDTEAAYPYRGVGGQCSFDSAKSGATISAWTGIPQGDEQALLDAVATVGPVSIAVDASIGWQLYAGGIMRGFLCSSNPKKLDHGVAIVGYGTDKGNDYWIVRNSWGSMWGEKGYARIARGKNACGLANAASYPTASASMVEA